MNSEPSNTRDTGRRRAPGRGPSTAVFALSFLVVATAAVAAWVVETVDVPPRLLAFQLDRLTEGHGALVRDAGRRLASLLLGRDRSVTDAANGSEQPVMPLGAARPAPERPGQNARIVTVGDAAGVAQAIAQARPGDVITLAPGTYRFSGLGIDVNRPGREEARVLVRAERPGTVRLEFDLSEGFVVSEPYWTFENLTIRGTCPRPADCEHAFHVVERGRNFVARNNTVTDFNAHFKINGLNGTFPDDGLIEGNTLNNSGVRDTDSSVTPIDLVAASRWRIRGNWISDFVKAGADRISYGVFVKGGGANNTIEANIVVCEYRLVNFPGQRIGLSLGGGGTGKDYCRDKRCITEQDGASIVSNLVASCSDDGVYVNRAANSKVLQNTLIDTAGVSVRFAESAAEVEGNLVDGAIRTRDGAALHALDNLDSSMTRLYLGSHPARRLLRDPARFDWSWAASPPRRPGRADPSIDLCGVTRAPQPVYGAFEDIAACGRMPSQSVLRP